MRAIGMITVIVAVDALTTGISVAGDIFRSVDERGNVTYSEEPLEDAARVQTVPIEPPPSGEQVEAAFRQQELDRKLLEQMEQSRLAREKWRAEQEKERRQRELDEAQLRHLQQMQDNRYDYNGRYLWPYFPYHARPPHGWRPPHHGHRPKPLPEYPPRRTAVVNVPGRSGK